MGFKRILSIIIPVIGTIAGAILTGICDFEDCQNKKSEESSDNETEAE